MSTIRTNTLSNVAGTQSTAIENAINGSAKAWVNFNGQNTIAIRASYNVSSITDNGLALYTVNFTNSMPDANYAIVGSAGDGGMNNTQYVVEVDGGALPTTSSFRINVGTTGTTEFGDPDRVSVTIFR